MKIIGSFSNQKQSVRYFEIVCDILVVLTIFWNSLSKMPCELEYIDAHWQGSSFECLHFDEILVAKVPYNFWNSQKFLPELNLSAISSQSIQFYVLWQLLNNIKKINKGSNEWLRLNVEVKCN